jgi:hypothetical protein
MAKVHLFPFLTVVAIDLHIQKRELNNIPKKREIVPFLAEILHPFHPSQTVPSEKMLDYVRFDQIIIRFFCNKIQIIID